MGGPVVQERSVVQDSSGGPDRVARFLRDAGPVAWDPAELHRAVLEPVLGRMLHTAADLEEDTGITRAQARALGIDRADDLAAFLPVWADEEAEHARALRALLAGRTYAPPPSRPPDISARRRLLTRLPLAPLRRLPEPAVVACTFGAAAEYVTIIVYRAVADQADDDVVRRLLRDIARQEARHLGFLLAAARARAAVLTPLHARVTRRVVRAMWEPPGVPSLGIEGWRDVFAPLLVRDDLRARVAAVDRMVDSIPHLEGLGLMEGFLAGPGGAIHPEALARDGAGD